MLLTKVLESLFKTIQQYVDFLKDQQICCGQRESKKRHSALCDLLILICEMIDFTLPKVPKKSTLLLKVLGPTHDLPHSHFLQREGMEHFLEIDQFLLLTKNIFCKHYVMQVFLNNKVLTNRYHCTLLACGGEQFSTSEVSRP